LDKKIFFFLLSLLLLSSCKSDGDSTLISPVLSSVFYTDIHYSIRFDKEGNSNVYRDGIRITNSESLKYDLDVFGNDVVWVEVKNSNTQTNIILNGKQLHVGLGYHYSPVLVDGILYWLKFLSDRQYICKMDLSEVQHNCQPSRSFSNAIFRAKNYIAGVFFYSDTLTYEFKVFDRAFTQVFVESFEESIYISGSNNNMERLYSVRGSSGALHYFWALKKLFVEQGNEPFSFSNDYLGRVSNNQSYRLQSLSVLYKKFRQPEIKLLLKQSVQEIVSKFDENGLLYSKKYSISGTSEIAFAVDNGLIWNAILTGLSILGEYNTSNDILLKAKRMIEFYEDQWYEDYHEYRIQSTSDVDYDGIVMPYNQQFALGLVLIKLYEMTNDISYYNRVEILFNKFTEDLQANSDTIIWRYWPSSFYDGWDSSRFSSQTRPSQLATSDLLFEDTIHATLVLDFLLEASLLLNKNMPIFINDIAENVVKDDNKFSFFVSGSEFYEPSWRYLPTGVLGNSPFFSGYYENDIIRSYPDYDDQLLFLTYSLLSSTTSGQLVISEYIFENNVKLVKIKDHYLDFKSCSGAVFGCEVFNWWKKQN
tara:strand:- start:120017 stop:121789 length:1773 start_codon:yes stop_codon:yes gene_type:complete